MEEIQQTENISEWLEDINARLRILEEKYNMFGERLLIINQNMIEEYKKIMRQIKDMDVELKDVKTDVHKIKNVVKDMTSELDFFARKEHLKVLEKYINLWNPMNFVTEKEAKRLIKEELDKL